MKSNLFKFLLAPGLLALVIVSLLVVAPRSKAQGPTASANGQGTLLSPDGRRQFALSARLYPDGTVNGNAILHNPEFTTTNGQRYQLQVDIQCMKVVGNIAIFGGTTRRTNDPTLVDAVFFSVQDNGEPGRGADRISRAFFWDSDPTTTGDPQACQFVTPTDFPLETIEAGNIQVK